MSKKQRRILIFFLIAMVIEFVDEFIGSIKEAFWPIIKSDLGLNYTQIGLLLAIPMVIGNLAEIFIFISGDIWSRKKIITIGGIFFCLSLMITGLSFSFLPLLLSFIIFYPASGAFVSLTQATLMDIEPQKRELNMAWWTFAGSAGVVLGPLIVSVAIYLNISYRIVFIISCILILPIIIINFLQKNFIYKNSESVSIIKLLKTAVSALKRKTVIKWLVLLEFSDLMLDVLMGFIALYFVDLVKTSPIQASFAVFIWSGVGLLGDFGLIFVLKYVNGLQYLKYSVIIEFVLYPLFLLIPFTGGKMILLGLIGFFNAGWYSIMQAKLFAEMPGKSGLTLAIKNISGLVGSLFPFYLGLIADLFGLHVTMWLLLLGPIVLFFGLFQNNGTGFSEK